MLQTILVPVSIVTGAGLIAGLLLSVASKFFAVEVDVYKRQGYTMAVMKAVFVVLTRGFVAGMLSLSGGIFSVTAIVLVDFLSKHSLHYITLSVIGAIFHNIGQLILARYLTSVFLYYYIPVLLVTGLVVGIITGKLFVWIIPYIPKRYRTQLREHRK